MLLSECSKCPNRIYEPGRNFRADFCTLPCPADKALKRWDALCFPCSEPRAVRLDSACNFDKDCNVCPNRTILHDIGGNIPSLPNCPGDKPLTDDEGNVFPL